MLSQETSDCLQSLFSRRLHPLVVTTKPNRWTVRFEFIRKACLRKGCLDAITMSCLVWHSRMTIGCSRLDPRILRLGYTVFRVQEFALSRDPKGAAVGSTDRIAGRGGK